MLSPLAGRDAHATLDSATLGASILAMLQTEPRFAALSPKFSILLDGGERLAELAHPHDIWLSALPGRPNGPWLAAGLAGCPPVHASATGPMIAVPATHAVAFVHALLLAFLDLASGADTRMRDLLRHVPAETLLARAQARGSAVPEVDAALDNWRRAPADPLLRFGIHAERDPELGYVGGQPPLGRLDGAQWLAVATLADSLGLATLRITPWQGLLLPGIARAALPHALARLRALGFVCDASAPLAGVVACAGSTGCARAQADTKGDALRLAASLTQATDIHLSGCGRSCAQAHAAAHTLLAVAPGRYDLYRRDAEAGFGSVVARHITIDQAAARLGGTRQLQEAPDA
jgi:precorrin-3B synthase